MVLQSDRADLKSMAKLLAANTSRCDLWEVFADFVGLWALAFRNTLEIPGTVEWQAIEEKYLKIASQYSAEEMDRFCSAGAALQESLLTDPRDVLGALYMDLEFGRKSVGQHFTPAGVARLVAGMTMSDSDIASAVAARGYVTIYEPACGAGAMVIAAAEVVRRAGFDPRAQLRVVAEDVAIVAVHMAYVQFSMLGLAAVVSHRNTLTGETFSVWPTRAAKATGCG